MKMLLAVIGVALLLAACGNGSLEKVPPGNGIDASDSSDSADAEPNGSDSGSFSNVFRTGELGLLVTAPEGTVVQDWPKPAWSTQSMATAKFVRPNGNEYTALVYLKEAGESFSQWLNHGETSTTFLSDQSMRTASGHTAYVYSTNDQGLVPDVHAMVSTDRFVYNFRWDAGLPEDPEEAVAAMRARDIRSVEVPADFLEFIGAIEAE